MIEEPVKKEKLYCSSMDSDDQCRFVSNAKKCFAGRLGSFRTGEVQVGTVDVKSGLLSINDSENIRLANFDVEEIKNELKNEKALIRDLNLGVVVKANSTLHDGRYPVFAKIRDCFSSERQLGPMITELTIKFDVPPKER